MSAWGDVQAEPVNEIEAGIFREMGAASNSDERSPWADLALALCQRIRTAEQEHARVAALYESERLSRAADRTTLTAECERHIARIGEVASEREAASLGLREALAAIEKAATILDGEARWSSLSRADLVLLLGRGMTFLDNAPEMIRASVVGSIPRSVPSQTASETLVGEGRDGDGSPCETPSISSTNGERS